jgi:RNA polymerase sigma-70 factor (ECF subfamily)
MDIGQRPPKCPTLPELVDDYYERLYRFAYRLSGSAADAEDLTQQTFLTAQKSLHQLREPEHAKAWMFTIMRNTFLKGRRRQKQTDTISLEVAPEPSESLDEAAKLRLEELQSILDELPDEFREPLVLFYFQEFSYKEIAEILEVPLGTVMSRLARGKKHLRKRLVPEEVDSLITPNPNHPE